MDPYLMIALCSLLVIISYAFNLFSNLTRVPAVILLMGTGLGLAFIARSTGQPIPDVMPILKIIGTVGLMIIVLEGALDLKMGKHNLRIMAKAFVSAFLILGITTVVIAFVLEYFLEVDFIRSLVYAIPIATVSSAIVIPSVHSLTARNRDFLVMESTFSDIIGIMAFDIIAFEPTINMPRGWAVGISILGSIIISAIFAVLLVALLNNMTSKLKLFLFMSILAMPFALGKYFHFPSLLIVLSFGLVLNNGELVFRGPLKKLLFKGELAAIRREFRMITEESSFLIRTFFFILFGFTLHLSELADPFVLEVGGIILGAIFFIRFLNLKFTSPTKSVFPAVLIAPRGLVTVLLFYKIPEAFKIETFPVGILVFIVLGTSLLMMAGLFAGKTREEEWKRKDPMVLQSEPTESFFNASAGASEIAAGEASQNAGGESGGEETH